MGLAESDRVVDRPGQPDRRGCRCCPPELPPHIDIRPLDEIARPWLGGRLSPRRSGCVWLGRSGQRARPGRGRTRGRCSRRESRGHRLGDANQLSILTADPGRCRLPFRGFDDGSTPGLRDKRFCSRGHGWLRGHRTGRSRSTCDRGLHGSGDGHVRRRRTSRFTRCCCHWMRRGRRSRGLGASGRHSRHRGLRGHRNGCRLLMQLRDNWRARQQQADGAGESAHAISWRAPVCEVPRPRVEG